MKDWLVVNTAFATGDVTIEAYSDIPSRIRAELRFRFRRQFGRIGVDGHPIVVVYRTEPHLLRFEWFIGPEALRIGRARREALR